MLYPPAIDDDVEMEYNSSDDEIDEGVTVKKKQKGGTASSDFTSGFVFEEDSQEEAKDDLVGVRPYLRKTIISTLQEKIDKERKKLSFADKPISSEQDSVVQELDHVSDNIREKKIRKRKKRQEQLLFDEKASAQAVAAISSEMFQSFTQLNLSRPLLKAVAACGFTDPTPIQSACIPIALEGRDICACAATGTGKTAAFMLPILERLLYKPKKKSVTRVVVLVPTRELAIQVFQVSQRLSQFSSVDLCLCAGGLDLKAQEAALRLGPDIVIATPGRLIDHLCNAPNFSLHNVEVLVLDEADRMLEEAFADQMKELIRLCAKNRQTMLFSATMTDQIEDLASMSLKEPVKLFINENTETALNLRQEFVRIRENHEKNREVIVAALVTRTFPDHSLVFVRTKKDCQRMHIILGLLGVKVGQLHSGLSQAQRVETLSKFKNGVLDVLVSTDLAARGLDIDGVLTVINMHMPMAYKQYVHRVGRTARAQRVGRSISLIGESDRKLLKEIVASNKDKSLKQRLIGTGVIDAYVKRIDSLAESIEKVEEEERVERALRMAQAELQRGEEKLNGEVKPRQWFQPESKKNKRKEREKRRNKAELHKSKNADISPDEISLQRLADYQVRQAKRMRRGKKIRAIYEDDDKDVSERKRKIKKSKSSFTSHLTSIGKSAVKGFRHGPSDLSFKAAKLKKLKPRKKR